MKRPVGSWFFVPLSDTVYSLWQETADGPMKRGVIYDQVSIDLICLRLNAGLTQTTNFAINTSSIVDNL